MKLPLKENEIVALARRMDLSSVLMKRHIEEQIISLVDLSDEWHANALENFLKSEKISETDLSDWLKRKDWKKSDLALHLARPEALYRFSKQRFGPGLEENYLSNAANLDTVIYSLLRVKDPLLAKELWMRLCEKEVSFVEVAANYGEGPEAQRKGLIGPIAIGSLEPPAMRKILKALRPGEFTPPKKFGQWHLLFRLEQINPSSFDENMRDKLLTEELNKFIEHRSIALINQEPVEPLHYDVES